MKATACEATTDPTKPGMGSKTVTYSDTADIYDGEYARQLVVFSDGDVAFVGADDAVDTWTFTAAMVFPQVIPVLVKRVKFTGTTVSAGDIKAIR